MPRQSGSHVSPSSDLLQQNSTRPSQLPVDSVDSADSAVESAGYELKNFSLPPSEMREIDWQRVCIGPSALTVSRSQ